MTTSSVPVVLVHGWGGSFASTWQRNGFTALLDDACLEVIGVDLLGHGDAPKPHDPDAYHDLTERVVEALPEGPTHPMSSATHGHATAPPNGASDVDTPAVVLADAVAPSLSVTVRVTVNVPLVQ